MEPQDREETYLASIAGQNVETPACPWNRKEAYLDEIDQHVEGMEGDIAKNKQDISDLNQKVAALATDFSYKGSVADYAHLPSDAAIGDVYTTEDLGYMYVWDGNNWQILNMTGAAALTGSSDPTTSTEGELGQLYLNTTSSKLFYCAGETGSDYTWLSTGETNTIESISVNGTAVTPDANKNVDLSVPNSAFTGTDGTAAGVMGLVPAPATTDAGKFLKADGTWDNAGSGDDAIELTEADFNYDYNESGTNNSIAAWLLQDGHYKFTQKDDVVGEMPVIACLARVENLADPQPVHMRVITGGTDGYGNGTVIEFWKGPGRGYLNEVIVWGTVSGGGFAGDGSYSDVGPSSIFCYSVRTNTGLNPDDSTPLDYDMVLSNRVFPRYFVPNMKALLNKFATKTNVSTTAAGLVPIIPQTVEVKQFTSAGWQPFARSDYEENDSSSTSYIENRPFCSYSSQEISSQNISYFGDIYETTSWSVGQWLNPWLSTKLDAAVYEDQEWMIKGESSLPQDLVTAITAGKTICVTSVGQYLPQISWMNEETMEDAYIYLRNCLFQAFQDDTASGYSVKYAIADAQYSRDQQTWIDCKVVMAYSPDGDFEGNTGGLATVVLRKMGTYGAPYGSNASPSSGRIAEWTNTEVLEQLDSKYIKVDDTTITVNSNGELQAAGGDVINGGTTQPTTSTVGAVGTQYNCVNNGTPEIYICTDTTGGTYTWTKVY